MIVAKCSNARYHSVVAGVALAMHAPGLGSTIQQTACLNKAQLEQNRTHMSLSRGRHYVFLK